MRPEISERESEIRALVGEHLTNAEIGGRLHISVRTVENSLHRIDLALVLTWRTTEPTSDSIEARLIEEIERTGPLPSVKGVLRPHTHADEHIVEAASIIYRPDRYTFVYRLPIPADDEPSADDDQPGFLNELI